MAAAAAGGSVVGVGVPARVPTPPLFAAAAHTPTRLERTLSLDFGSLLSAERTPDVVEAACQSPAQGVARRYMLQQLQSTPDEHADHAELQAAAAAVLQRATRALLLRLRSASEAEEFWSAAAGSRAGHRRTWLLSRGPSALCAEVRARVSSGGALRAPPPPPRAALQANARAANELRLRLAAAVGESHALAQQAAAGHAAAPFKRLWPALERAAGTGPKHCEPLALTWDGVGAARAFLARTEGAIDAELRALRPPSKLQQHWLTIAAVSVVGLTTAVWCVRHPDDLRRWSDSARAAFESFVRERILEPAAIVREELRGTFTPQQDVGVEQLAASQRSLERMMKDYVASSVSAKGGSVDVDSLDPMGFMLRQFEEEVKSPLYSIVGGDLPRLLLLQTQATKVELESALLQMDQLMRAQQLNLALFASFPALALVTMTVGGVSSAIHRREVRRARNSGLRMRLLLCEAHRSLLELRSFSGGSPPYVQEGLLLYSLNALYQAGSLHRARCPRQFPEREWLALRGDILTLAAPDVNIDVKLKTSIRIANLYSVFKSQPV